MILGCDEASVGVVVYTRNVVTTITISVEKNFIIKLFLFRHINRNCFNIELKDPTFFDRRWGLVVSSGVTPIKILV